MNSGRIASLAGVSALALIAAMFLPGSEASACSAVADLTFDPATESATTNFVNVSCSDGDDPSQFFETGHPAGVFFPVLGMATSYPLYDGSGNDELVMSGGTVDNIAGVNFTPPVTNLPPTRLDRSLDASGDPASVLRMLAGDDRVRMLGGTINGVLDTGSGNDTLDIGYNINLIATLGGIVLGDGSDNVGLNLNARVSEIAGIADGSISGGTGGDIIQLFDGSIVQGFVAGGDDDDQITIGGTVGGGTDTTNDFVDGGGGNDTIEINGLVLGSVFGDRASALAGNDTIRVLFGTIRGSIDTGAGNDRVGVLGNVAVGSTVEGSILSGAGDDFIEVRGDSTVAGAISAGTGDDEVQIGLDVQVGLAPGGADSVQLEDGDDRLVLSNGTLAGGVSGGEGDDTVLLLGGTVGTFVAGNAGVDTIAMSGTARVQAHITAGDGNDVVTLNGGSVGTFVDLGANNDEFRIQNASVAQSVVGDDGDDLFEIGSSATIGGDLRAGAGADTVNISGGTIGGGVDLGSDGDRLAMTGGSVAQDLIGGAGIDILSLTGGTIGGDFQGGDGSDVLTVGGTAVVTGTVRGEAGDDRLAVTGGTIRNGIDLGSGTDALSVSAGTVTGDVLGQAGDDVVAIGGTVNIAGSVVGGDGKDQVTISGGTISGGIDAESVTLTGGTIAGDITGIGPNTLVINAENLSLRDGVLFQGESAVGTVTGTDLAGGGNQNFAGFSSVTLDGNSTLRFAEGAQLIGNLSVLDESTLFVSGNSNLLAPGGGPGNLHVRNAAVNMVNGRPTDRFNVGDLTLDGATIAIDVDTSNGLSDLINAAGAVSSAGTNTVFVNLVGTPQLVSTSVIPIAPVAGEALPTGGDASSSFAVSGLPATPGALFGYQVVTGANGGLYLLATPTAPAEVLDVRAAVDTLPIGTVNVAVSDILNDSVLSNFALASTAGRSATNPNFGLYASGQAARINHDGTNVSGPGVTGVTPGFTANEFSVAASLEFDAAQYFGIDQSHGLDLGLFGGYVSSSVDLDPSSLFADIGSGENKGGMIGTYGLYRQGSSYGLVSVTGFFGNTEIANGVLGSTGDYDTAGIAVTGSAGHVLQLSEKIRFDLRGGVLGVAFRGDEFTDSVGVQFGASNVSFGALKFEPGIFGIYQMEDGKVFSPYARLDLQQRFGYDNNSTVQGLKFEFEDADFSAAAATGFNYQLSKMTTMSAEVRGKLSKDADTIAGKIGFKATF